MVFKSLHTLNNTQYFLASSTKYCCHWESPLPLKPGLEDMASQELCLPQAHLSFSCWSFSKNFPCTFKGSKVGPGDSQDGWPGKAGISSCLTLYQQALATCQPPTWNTTNEFISEQSPSLTRHLCNSEAHVFAPNQTASSTQLALQPSAKHGEKGPRAARHGSAEATKGPISVW